MREAPGVLKGYAFIIERDKTDTFDIHRLVRLATRNWLRDNWVDYTEQVFQHLTNIYPYPKYENRKVWKHDMPHALSLIRCECQLRYIIYIPYLSLAHIHTDWP
jgi:hypothetical protein